MKNNELAAEESKRKIKVRETVTLIHLISLKIYIDINDFVHCCLSSLSFPEQEIERRERECVCEGVKASNLIQI
jgi:hypothetical protein